MNEQLNASSGKSIARQEFARRLRELRVPRGFRTARSLARALSIDENRYTRYERAEVEPDLELLVRICGTLGVTPNELLGIDSLPQSAVPTAGAMADPPAEFRAEFPPAEAAPPAFALQSIGWSLCRLVVQLRQNLDATSDGGTPSPLAYLQLVTSLQLELDRQPFEVIRQIVRDPAVIGAPDAVTYELHDLILRLTQALAQMNSPPRPV